MSVTLFTPSIVSILRKKKKKSVFHREIQLQSQRLQTLVKSPMSHLQPSLASLAISDLLADVPPKPLLHGHQRIPDPALGPGFHPHCPKAGEKPGMANVSECIIFQSSVS